VFVFDGRLIDGENVTTCDEHMWLIPFTEGAEHQLRVQFSRSMPLTGIRLWNYNKSPEDTYRGVGTFVILILVTEQYFFYRFLLWELVTQNFHTPNTVFRRKLNNLKQGLYTIIQCLYDLFMRRTKLLSIFV